MPINSTVLQEALERAALDESLYYTTYLNPHDGLAKTIRARLSKLISALYSRWQVRTAAIAKWYLPEASEMMPKLRCSVKLKSPWKIMWNCSPI